VIPVFSLGTSIPRVICQVYPTCNLPEVLAQNVRSIREINPGWAYRFFDDAQMEDWIQRNYGAEVLGYYHRINPKYGAARADFFRYLLIYKLGGVYFDIKSSTSRPLDEVLRPDDVYLLSRWPEGVYAGWGKHEGLEAVGGHEFQQWHVIAAPGHPFLRAVLERIVNAIDRYDPWRDGTGKRGVLHLTGPIAYTLAIAPLLAHPHRLVSSEQDLGLLYSVFGKNTTQTHRSLFKSHYTKLDEPIITGNWHQRILWRLLWPIRKRLS